MQTLTDAMLHNTMEVRKSPQPQNAMSKFTVVKVEVLKTTHRLQKAQGKSELQFMYKALLRAGTIQTILNAFSGK